MFDLEKAIKEWKHSLRKNRGYEDGDIEELESHLRDRIDELIDSEISEKEAFELSSEEIGNIDVVGSELHKTRAKKIHWEQPSGIVALLPNYIKIAWRNLVHRIGYSSINVVGLSVGIASCLLIALYVQYELSYDSFHESPDRTYRVLREFQLPDLEATISTTPPALAPTAKENFPAVEEAVRVQSASLTIEYADKKFVESSFLDVEEGFFEIFNFPLIKGEAALNRPNTILITERAASKYFGNENPVGKTLKVARRDLEVTGVLKNPPGNTHLQFDFIASLWEHELYWGRNNYTSYFLLREGTDKEEFTNQLAELISQNVDPEGTEAGNSFIPHLQPVKDIYLGQGVQVDIGSEGNIQYLYLFIALAIFIVILACINFMNLATARSMERAREVGVRKTLGGNRIQIAFQFLGESLLMAIIASLLAILICKLTLPFLNAIAESSITFGFLLTPGNLLGILTLTLLTGLIAGLYPAFILSNFQPSKVLKGTSFAGQGSLLRKSLVVFQFTISIALLAGTGIIYKQVHFMKSNGLGFSPENVILVEQAQFLGNQRSTFKGELERISGIELVSSGFSVPGSFFINSMWQTDISGTDAYNLDYSFVDFDYLETLELELVAGRSFSAAFPADTFNVILNESAVKDFGWTPDEAVNHKLIQGQREYDVIGVVKDFNYRSLHAEIYPLALFGPRRFPRYIVARVTEEASLPQIIENIDSEWKNLSSLPLEYSFLADDLQAQYEAEDNLMQVFSVFAGLAIFIGCLGLLGLAAFMVAKRTKEIGVRKVLGATSTQVVRLISTDLIRLVTIGFFVAIPLSWFLMSQWLKDFAYRTEISWWIFLLAGLIALTISLLTVSGQALRAAYMNPVNSLKSE